MAKLTDEQVQDGLTSLPGWERQGDEIVKEYKFGGFGDAVAFVTRIAFRADKADHHPDLDIRYNKVRVALSTHSEGGLTGKDLDLAAQVEAAAFAEG